jgi:transposase
VKVKCEKGSGEEEQQDLYTMAPDFGEAGMGMEGEGSGQEIGKGPTGNPRLKTPNREQMVMLAIDVERLVPRDHSVRAIWELVGSLDLSGYVVDIKAVEGGAGRPCWDPRLLISLWIYAYSRGVNSAREIERLSQHDPAYQWLVGLEEVNHHTLSDFRARRKEELSRLFAELLGVLRAEELITLERVTQDGTKIKACASTKTFKREEKIRECIRQAEEHIRELDAVPEEELSRRKAKARERAARERKENLEKALGELPKVRAAKSGAKEKKNARVSISDPDARKMRQADGGYAPSYNVQITTDAAHKIIVGVEVTQAGNDYEGLEKGIDGVVENTGEMPKQVIVDGGYTNAENIIAMEKCGIDLIGAFGNQHEGATACERRGTASEYLPEKFAYDPTSDIYTCPAGKVLHYVGDEVEGRKINHKYQAEAAECMACPHKRECCPKATKRGRSIMRGELRPEVASFAAKMETDEAKEIYKQRGPIAEFPNAWIKDKLGLRQFELRGLDKVGTEALWACLTYNIQQWIRLRWRPRLAIQLTACARDA